MISNRAVKISKWLLFTAAVSIIPLGLDWLFRYMHGSHGKWHELVGAGQLFLVSSALAASGLGEVFGAFKRTEVNIFHHVVTGFLGLICILITIGLYGFMSAAMSVQQDPAMSMHGPQILSLDKIKLAYLQLACFTVSFIVGLYAQQFD